MAGISGNTFFVRSSDDAIQLFPHGRLQIDGFWLARNAAADLPSGGSLVRRARIELAGRLGPWIGFSLGSDFATTAVGTDNFLVIDPLDRRLYLQVGQFNAPFTYDNSISDKYFDYIERSMTARVLGVPSNKEVGAMLAGVAPQGLGHWAIGLFDGNGQNARDTDNHPDLMGRLAVAPLALAPWQDLRRVTVGASLWLADRRDNLNPLAAQTTPDGFKLLDPTWKATDATATQRNYELRQFGEMRSMAVELNAPIGHRLGVRGEWLYKRQGLAEVTTADGKTAGTATLTGTSYYVGFWWWAVGDDSLVPQDPTGALPTFSGLKPSALTHGLQLLARVERLDEDVVTGHPSLANPGVGGVRVDAGQLGVNYWYSKRFRASLNASTFHLQGDSKAIKGAVTRNGGSTWEQELALRLAIAL